MNTKVIIPVVVVILVVGGIGAYTYTDMSLETPDGPDTPDDPEDPTDGDGTGTDGEDGSGEDDSSDGPDGTSGDSLFVTLEYNAQDVLFGYNYLEDQATSAEETPTELVLHTGETPDSGTVIHQFENIQSSGSVELGFSEDFNVEERSDLPSTKVTATFEDGSTEVITEESLDGSGPPIRDQINVEKSAQNGETVVTANAFDADYLTVESGGGDVVGRIDEEGGSVTIPVEEAYARQSGDNLSNRLTFQIMAHIGDNDTRLQLVTAGYPDPVYSSSQTANDRYLTQFEMTRYDEITVFGGNMAVGTQNPNAELSQSEAQITEPTNIVSEELLIVEVETEAGHTITLFPSPVADQN